MKLTDKMKDSNCDINFHIKLNIGSLSRCIQEYKYHKAFKTGEAMKDDEWSIFKAKREQEVIDLINLLEDEEKVKVKKRWGHNEWLDRVFKECGL